MPYPKICLKVILGRGAGRGEGVIWLGVKGRGKSMIATYPENFALISQLEEGQEGGVKKVVLGGC